MCFAVTNQQSLTSRACGSLQAGCLSQELVKIKTAQLEREYWVDRCANRMLFIWYHMVTCQYGIYTINKKRCESAKLHQCSSLSGQYLGWNPFYYTLNNLEYFFKCKHGVVHVEHWFHLLVQFVQMFSDYNSCSGYRGTLHTCSNCYLFKWL